MTGPAWMPFYPADYLAGTGHLTRAQHGAYLLLILHYWAKGGLPADDRLLARIARMTDREWRSEKDILAEFFTSEWRHPRIEKELEKAREKSDKRAEAGARGGEAKALKNNGGHVASATVLPQQKDDFALASSSQSEKKSNRANALSSAEADETEQMVEIYHAVGEGIWPKVLKVTPPRKAAAKHRLKDCGGIDGWRDAMVRARGSPHLTGQNSRGWVADFDFFLQAKSFTKLLEGSYDARTPAGFGPGRAARSGADVAFDVANDLLGQLRDGGERPASHPGTLDAVRDGTGVYRL